MVVRVGIDRPWLSQEGAVSAVGILDPGIAIGGHINLSVHSAHGWISSTGSERFKVDEVEIAGFNRDDGSPNPIRLPWLN